MDLAKFCSLYFFLTASIPVLLLRLWYKCKKKTRQFDKAYPNHRNVITSNRCLENCCRFDKTECHQSYGKKKFNAKKKKRLPI